MAERNISRVRAFYAEYLPVGDRLGEMFYAVWMVVVSLGILGGTEFERGAIAYVIIIAFAVNTTWGLIDGLTVMHSNIIERARYERLVYDLQSRGDQDSRAAGAEALKEGITTSLSPADQERVLDMIVNSPLVEDPRKKRYYPYREDWDYALGILAIDVALVLPLVAPLFIFPDHAQALYVSRLIATLLFAVLGAAYAKHLNRRRWVAALFLGTLCFAVFNLAYLAGW
jgi:VIT1/CCC1 family predicted Fe2+/Mn2+ transporter